MYNRNGRAGGNGRTGRKNGVAWILTYAYVIEWSLRAVCRSLGSLRVFSFSSFQGSKVTTRELRYLSARRARKLARANMRVVHGGHFWQLASLATETTGGVILVSQATPFAWEGVACETLSEGDFGPNMASEAISECLANLRNFPGGACPQTPLACSHRKGHTSLK